MNSNNIRIGKEENELLHLLLKDRPRTFHLTYWLAVDPHMYSMNIESIDDVLAGLLTL